MNRRLVTLLASLHFAPTERAAANLRAEAVPADSISVTGNTVVDAFRAVVSMPFDLSASPLAELAVDERLLVLATVHRRENHGAAIAAVCAALQAIARRFANVRLLVPVHLNPNVRRPMESALSGIENVTLVAALDYQSLVWALNRCRFVITDSGGLQEEAAVVGTPVLVLRETTERIEGVEAGIARLVGTNPDQIISWASRLLEDDTTYKRMARTTSLYGDGHAAVRIVDLLERPSSRRPASTKDQSAAALGP
jgi:UDP-N-acetylglucosamine 2-epimerase